MKQLLYSFSLVMMMLLTACSADELPTNTSEDICATRSIGGRRTVLIYMAGRNDLHRALNKNLKDIIEGSKQLSSHDNLVVFVRRYDSEDTPWIARIKDGMVTDSVSITDLGLHIHDPRACDPEVMRGVMNYVYRRYTASEDYGLVLWGHGGGWLMQDETPKTRGYGRDDGNHDDSGKKWINYTTMRNIMAEMPHLRFIMADCCNFMCLENLYELRECADYAIGSPAEIPWQGAPYKKMLPLLFSDAKDFYVNIVDTYYLSVGGNLPLSVVRMSEMQQLADATRQVMQSVHATMQQHGEEYLDLTGRIHYNHLDKGQNFLPEYNIFHDAGDVIRHNAAEADYQAWLEALDRTVIDRRMAMTWSTDKFWSMKYFDFTMNEQDYHGVSMYFEQNPEKGNYGKFNNDIRQYEWYKAVWQ